MRIALDTNFLVYAEGVNGADRKAIATQVLTSFAAEEIVLPVQALGELFTVLTRKAGWPADQARAAVLGWHGAFRAVDTSSQVLLEAMELAARHQLSLWDAIMLAAAAQAGCRVLLCRMLMRASPSPRSAPMKLYDRVLAYRGSAWCAHST